jgi:hypothetical protein
MMLTNTSFQTRNVVTQSLPTKVLDIFINIRQEWELVAGGTSLMHCESPVGLLLFDIVVKLGIPAEEQRRLLGPALFDEVTKFVTKQG